MKYWINEEGNICLEFEQDHHEFTRMMVMVNRGRDYFESVAEAHPASWVSAYAMQYMISSFAIQDNYDDVNHTIQDPIHYRSDKILIGQLRAGAIYKNHNPTLQLYKPLTIKQMDFIAERIISGNVLDLL